MPTIFHLQIYIIFSIFTLLFKKYNSTTCNRCNCILPHPTLFSHPHSIPNRNLFTPHYSLPRLLPSLHKFPITTPTASFTIRSNHINSHTHEKQINQPVPNRHQPFSPIAYSPHLYPPIINHIHINSPNNTVLSRIR